MTNTASRDRRILDSGRTGVTITNIPGQSTRAVKMRGVEWTRMRHACFDIEVTETLPIRAGCWAWTADDWRCGRRVFMGAQFQGAGAGRRIRRPRDAGHDRW